MKFFADTAEIADIKELTETGLLDGVTTNPSLIAKSGRDFIEVTREICALTHGPVSAEVVALDHETMMKEAEILRKIADNVCIKVPLTIDGLKTCNKLTSDGTMVNVTLCFSANQALLAAKAGATFVSPFVGRHDDNGFDGMALIADIKQIYTNYDFTTEILVASVRHGIHVHQAALLGADVMTAPPAVIKGLFKHILTEKGIEGFLADWAKNRADYRLMDMMTTPQERGPDGKLIVPEEVQEAIRTLIRWSGDDPTREGLVDTPARVGRAWREYCRGYGEDPAVHLSRTFQEVGGYHELVLLKDIPFQSHCEHHMAPITGKASIGYMPTDRVVGISKLVRVLNGFAQRLQVQERLTAEVANAIWDNLKPHGVAVVIEAQHGCMTGRGVKVHGSGMVTSKLIGCFLDDQSSRKEVMSLMGY